MIPERLSATDIVARAVLDWQLGEFDAIATKELS